MAQYNVCVDNNELNINGVQIRFVNNEQLPLINGQRVQYIDERRSLRVIDCTPWNNCLCWTLWMMPLLFSYLYGAVSYEQLFMSHYVLMLGIVYVYLLLFKYCT